jgi:hypothetical protein
MSGVSAPLSGGDARRRVTEVVIATEAFSRARDQAQASWVGDLLESWIVDWSTGFSGAELRPNLARPICETALSDNQSIGHPAPSSRSFFTRLLNSFLIA